MAQRPNNISVAKDTELINACESLLMQFAVEIQQTEAPWTGSSGQTTAYTKRIEKYKHGGDFTIIKPTVKRDLINNEMKTLLHKSDDKWIKYDFINGIKELLNRRFGFKLTINLKDDREICSDYVCRYASNLDIVTTEFKNKIIVFPEDYIRYVNDENANVIR